MYSSNTYSTPNSHQAQQNYQSQNQFAPSGSSSSSFNPNSSQPQYQPFGQSQASSPFGSSQQNQSPFGQQQYGGGYSGGGQQPGLGHGQPGGAHGGQTKPGEKRYMLGYLSSGTMAQPEATPPKNGADDSNMRPWDSPTNRASTSGASPLARGAIFANNNPSRPSASAPPSDPRGGYGAETEDNGPPMQSLSDFDGADASMSFSSPEPTAADSRRPPLPSTHSTQSFSSLRPSATTPAQTFAADVFGFPAAATSAVIELFRECGDIVKATPADGGNWVTLHFADAVSVRRAARKNGQTVPWQGGLVMIGVKATDEDALNAAMHGTEAGSVPSGEISRVGTPARGGRSVTLSEGTAFKTAAPTPPRRGFFGGGATPAADPHASLFAGANQQAVMKQGEAQKGVTGKVMDLVFGW